MGRFEHFSGYCSILVHSLAVTEPEEALTKNILVVEDDFANRQVALLFLKKLGYEVDLAENGSICLEKVNEKVYDLILMDCQMPIINGFEATETIRASENANQSTPIIALTANLINGIDQKCLKAGMNGVLNKPINMEILRKTVEEWTIKPHQSFLG